MLFFLRRVNGLSDHSSMFPGKKAHASGIPQTMLRHSWLSPFMLNFLRFPECLTSSLHGMGARTAVMGRIGEGGGWLAVNGQASDRGVQSQTYLKTPRTIVPMHQVCFRWLAPADHHRCHVSRSQNEAKQPQCGHAIPCSVWARAGAEQARNAPTRRRKTPGLSRFQDQSAPLHFAACTGT
jgi:hypothetical protein